MVTNMLTHCWWCKAEKGNPTGLCTKCHRFPPPAFIESHEKGRTGGRLAAYINRLRKVGTRGLNMMTALIDMREDPELCDGE